MGSGLSTHSWGLGAGSLSGVWVWSPLRGLGAVPLQHPPRQVGLLSMGQLMQDRSPPPSVFIFLGFLGTLGVLDC